MTDEKNKSYHTGSKSFMIYKDWEKYFSMLSDSETADVLRGLFAFAARGEKVHLEGMSAMAYAFMTDIIESDGRKWEEKVLKNSENGKKGGRPPKAKKPDGFSENQT